MLCRPFGPPIYEKERSTKKVTTEKKLPGTTATTTTSMTTTTMVPTEGPLAQTTMESPLLFVREDNPIMNHLVLDFVFDFLQLPALKSCRLVCTKWGEPATRKMLTVCTLSIDAEDCTKISEIQSAMLAYGSKFLFRNFTMDKITHATYPNIWPLLGPHVRSFTISHWWDDPKDLTLQDYEDLLLKRCPCLEELVLPSTKNFKKAKNFLLCAQTVEPGQVVSSKFKNRQISLNLRILKVKGIARPEARFWRIISVSPKLRSLHMECHLVEEFWNPNLRSRPQWVERMSNLRELEVRSYANEGATETAVRYFLSTPWALSKLTYECYDLSETILRESSEHLKQTLEYLQVALFNKKYEPWPADLRGDWMTSHMLTKLRHYGLEIDEQCEGPIFCRTLVLSMFIPNLECLSLTMYDDGENHAEWEEGLFQIIFEDCMTFDPRCQAPEVFQNESEITDEDSVAINQNSNGSVQIHGGDGGGGGVVGQRMEIRREKMKKLILPPKMRDTSFIVPVLRVYPNINDLSLQRPCPQVVSAIFMHWRQLERLTMTLSIDDEFCVGVNWNWVLTGLQVIQQPGQVQAMAFFNGASVVNLQRLTSLDLKMVSKSGCPDPHSMLLNDVLIYNGLTYLTGIQHIAIEGQMFSDDAVTFLRHNLLPFCNLEFERGELEPLITPPAAMASSSSLNLHHHYYQQQFLHKNL